jgi:flagellar hook assembly protein FlgD
VTAKRTNTAALVVFGLLAVATVGAFFVTQRLKRGSAVVKKISTPLYVSPNGDGRKDTAHISFRLPKGDRVTVAIVDGAGDEVRRLVDDRKLGRGPHSVVWSGRDNSGSVPPDGRYYLRVILRGQGRATTAPRGILLITTPPRPKLVSVSPQRIRPGGRPDVSIRFSGPTSPPPLFSVYRTGDGPPRLVHRFAGARGSNVGHWDGTDANGRPVPPGTYAVAVTVQNRALVNGSAPAQLPPTPKTAVRGTGVTVAGAEATAPLEPVRAGRVVRIHIPGVRGRVRYTLTRLGESRPLRHAVARAPVARIGIPRRARTGLYTLRLRTAAGQAASPLVVRGHGGGKVLVVLPAIAWQGLNPADDDANGFPNTLADSQEVALNRPFALGRLPAAIRRETAPLLAFLDRRHLAYDLTTDLALAHGGGPRIAGHSGILFAGSELWLSEDLDSELRRYVEDGGRVASFGTDAFRRTVTVGPATLSGPSGRQQTNVFGEQTAFASSAAAPIVVSRDALGLFGGSDGFVGLFTRFEQQRALVAGASAVVAAGRDPKHPAFVAYRLGKGIVVRAGTPQWAAALGSDSEVQAVTRSTWDLLSR